MFLNSVFLNDIGEKILKFFNPQLKYENRITKKWFLMSPSHFFIVFFSYFIFIIVAYLHKLKYNTKRKQIFDKQTNKNKNASIPSKKDNSYFQNFLSKIIPIYNLIQVFCSFYITLFTLYEAKNRNFSLVYNPSDYTQDSIAFYSWLFYINKMCDFFDTILIVLRSKWNQFTFLHVYHHLSVFFIMWVNTSVGYDGDIYYVISINSFVHFIMYFYYFFTSLKIKVPIYLKTTVTYIQMIQFLSILLPCLFVLFFNFICEYPIRLVALSFCYCISLLILFINFSIQTYIFQKNKID
ncbi:long chain polyunsaturated fatty acid elongation enzyme, putative [Plasmodium gallinaceum]|uniref:Elongation of fatty acids protein n=1 Tax=Plasmodium gallinaceum TaxID=5849 RepID=A0A1J1GQS8_PLAGA|nr:long chain polyunsaturated fatty acid elongation enzyme, putative [Plasmodium gallinaceum]CRG93639.1 long chain polyunsaturated fatty acid elongation enzyme, putative [Plasmodium gallinaceum]